MSLRTPSESGQDVLEPDSVDELRTRRAPKRRKQRSKLRWLAIAAGAVVCAALLIVSIAVGVMLFLSRNTSSPYKVGQALEHFRQLQRRDKAASTGSSSGLPTPGVYTYSTSGSESASAPGLLTNAHGYPATTTITVFSDGCGEDWRWQPLTNRYEDLVTCRAPTGALMLQSRFDTEEFYGATDRRNFKCSSDSVLLPARARAGETFGGVCTNGGDANSGGLSISYKGEVIADDVVQVGGTGVPATHLVLNEKMTGHTVGSGTESIWLARANGLPVKVVRSENTRSDSVVGWVPSSDTFTLELVSLAPQR